MGGTSATSPRPSPSTNAPGVGEDSSSSLMDAPIVGVENAAATCACSGQPLRKPPPISVPQYSMMGA